MGAANPSAAARLVKNLAAEIGLKGLKIAAVLGDNIYDKIQNYLELKVLETGTSLKDLKGDIVSANVYLGIEGIIKALEGGADVVITGRVADPALFLAPMVYEYGWDIEDYDLLGQGTLIGHLLECAAQVTGGYFAEPGYKDVPDLWKVGFPIAEVFENGDDVVADFTDVVFEEIGVNRVKVTGGKGTNKPETLKASIGYRDCYIGEGEISYGGSGALNRAKLAGEIVKKRLELMQVPVEELRVDLIGVNSLYGDVIGEAVSDDGFQPIEVRLRVAGRTSRREDAVKIANEVETLYTNGPASGGGATKSVKEIISIASVFIPREDVKLDVVFEEV